MDMFAIKTPEISKIIYSNFSGFYSLGRAVRDHAFDQNGLYCAYAFAFCRFSLSYPLLRLLHAAYLCRYIIFASYLQWNSWIL